MEWKNIYRGMLMGASDVIPGVSGGTIAVLLGIYDRLIAAINGFLSKNWKEQLGFLIPLGTGIVIAIFSLSHLIEWLFDHYPKPLQFFFLGLILGILPYLFRQADAKHTFRARHVLILVIGAVIVGLLAFISANEGTAIQDKTLSTYIWLLFSGFLASSAMVLPGISGSLILLILGVFKTVMAGISNLQLDVIVTVGIGIVLGVMVMSKIIHFFLAHYRIATFAFVTGLVIGSLAVVFPGWPATNSLVLVSVVTFALGLAAAYILGKIEYED
ncbi:DUF368 domain-containing protein [Lentibacillus cibarius]|uniref:DUF368 domain-containing protein n=1 Tax=Lentibacillus cibarius TaxID=2583219 RepID=A0A5S3QMW2_9BACI|nr:DUF368 domain-containing protein [Lentibacillus cibarius]TMN22551.1 DUF368 domain-containing protein [Lentibacillus cibarius]